MTHPFRTIVMGSAAFALLIAVVLAIAPQGEAARSVRPVSQTDQGPQGEPARPVRPVSQTDHSVLQRDAEMTQQMSVSGAPGVMEQGRTPHDDQLVHSSQSGFTADLEQHQADIDRMLARGDR
jgi:hypothetical protein